ncbi:hypothetical protein Cantr_08250 [Candida viswanathii]|uniref:F-box domain-containing protein n=1 Tax=Candida viswanathii TaxID=5486 RepID=A0A367Y728_9ASCO|nr:hypothetical protein Cantr_08250 [Candida viswanathii]
MGFISPGKSLKRQRPRKNGSPSPSPSGPLSKIQKTSTSPQPPMPPPPPTPQQNNHPEHLTLDTLPIEILHKIFVYVGPSENNLPLVNRRLYSILYFSGVKSLEPWYNFTVFERIVDRYYLCDLNSRIDVGVILKKSAYYARQIRVIKQRFPNCSENRGFANLVGDLAVIMAALDSFITRPRALLVDMLQFKFVSVDLLKTLNTRQANADAGYIPIKSSQEVQLIQKLRLKFLRTKFKELGDQLRDTTKALANEDQPLDTPIDSTDPEDEQDPEIKYYDDENFPTEGFFWSTSEQYTRVEDGHVVFNEGFETLEKLAFGRARIPDHYFTKSIYSSRHYDVLVFLTRHFEFGTIDGPYVMDSILDVLENPDEYATAYWPRLNAVVDVVMRSNDPRNKFTETLSRLFKLYNGCMNKDYSVMKYKHAKDFPNLVARTMAALLKYFFENAPSADEKRQLWITAMELKNIHITDLLREFDDTPDYDILHRFV